MSRHYFDTNRRGKDIRITAGWDRPLHGFHLAIEYRKTVGDECPFLFNNLELENPHPKSFQPFLDILHSYGIHLPAEMIEEIIEDGAQDMGNKDVIHRVNDGAYERKELPS